MEFPKPTPEIPPSPPAGGPQPPAHLEREIAELERALAEKREQARQLAGGEVQPQVPTPQPPPPTAPPPLTSAQVAQKPRAEQVKLLTDVALEQGIKEAVDIARKVGSAYLLDELHDALQDELYKALKGSEP